MEERTGSAEGYRFGFQGQETDDEVYGAENAVSFKYRVHDARIGRFLSLDPLAPEYPWNSPYAFSENRVTDAVELEGLESFKINDENGDEATSYSANSGPLSEQTIENEGFTHYELRESYSHQETRTETIPTETINTEGYTSIVNIYNDATFRSNLKRRYPRQNLCLHYGTTYCETLTGANTTLSLDGGGFNLANETAFTLGEELVALGVAREAMNVNTVPTDYAQDIIDDSRGLGGRNYSLYLFGGGNAYHTFVVGYDARNNDFTLFDQGTGWAGDNLAPATLNARINSINASATRHYQNVIPGYRGPANQVRSFRLTMPTEISIQTSEIRYRTLSFPIR